MSIQTFHSTSKSTLIWNAGTSSQESAIPAILVLKLVWVFLDLCMLCIWITCKVIRTVLYVLKEKQNYKSRSLWNTTWPFLSLQDAVQTEECRTWRSPFYESRWWANLMKVSLCFAQIMCAMSVFCVLVGLCSQAKGCRLQDVLRWTNCTPRLHYSLNCTSLETHVDSY